ncbi:RNA 2',3'-cyclic phosphodiesterase [Seongchinamella sediminis]|uniref:RNA 2',3'-cyclic phosphodiesterase n=1 Tax=Seongchinamella sediminis TaxID=2283635 RepID=A0A3L7DXS0_9GAMM|nr:RNA 2',3'-cyclic phosphodiesterase [Seongchinamella sediminis]RLQ21986.1 RNA 2',3'-cyclic phosphodiesterase [Seongchinamella sediminis]
MRLFFALELPGELAIQIADWRQRQLPALGRPVPPANFHITLAFLGELGEKQLEQLCLATDELVAQGRFEAGEIILDQVGYWPKPGIYWLGPKHWPDSLGQLADTLARRGNALGAKRKRGQFRPHLTLFRGCQAPPPAAAELGDFPLPYHGFTLLESRAGRNGVRYSPVARWHF